MAQTKTTQQFIDEFCRRQEALAIQHLQDLELLTTTALRWEQATQHHPAPLSKRMFQGIDRVGKWLVNRFLFRRHSSQPLPGQSGQEPDQTHSVVIDTPYRVLSSRQEGKK
jgi:hypothetical protein